MLKKSLILLTLIFVLTSCTVQQDTVNAIPWWGWLIIILCLLVVLYINFFLATDKEPSIDLPEKMAEPVEIEVDNIDDLTLIEGIGPKIQSILREASVDTYAKIADLLPEEIMGILQAGGIRLAVAETWPKQAKLAAEGKMAELDELQEKLKGGRTT